ncbi:penicillin acylase family protein [Sorangium sp. So ce136]|uniref:penicillin acylase family protein n=1 Tax=Sorangium sp. So ce136 TaxID=3133284 RepID=UPI003F0BAECA
MRRNVRTLLLSALASLALAGCAERTQGAARAPAPRADEAATLAGLERAVTVTSDRLGIPTIRAASRLDALRALGFVTARDRLFQLDLLRRSSGERSADIVRAWVDGRPLPLLAGPAERALTLVPGRP